MQLNPVMEKFYKAILDYSGMSLENNVFTNKNEKIGPMTIDDRHLTLPYFDNLKNPEGKVIFHPLNENYTSPETAVFNLFKRRLVLELNLKLQALFVSLIGVAGDVTLQQRVKSSKLIELIGNVGGVELAVVEALQEAAKSSKKVNNEAFLFDIFLKKNGEINDTPYAAIGKVNFLMFTEVNRALTDGDHKVYGKKLNKKDLIPIDNLFRVVFPSIDSPESYVEGTDNKVFRYLNILLKTSYQISARINEIADLLEELNEPILNLSEVRSNLEWTECLEDLYNMATEIRLIPNQTDLTVEANKLKLDESKASASAPSTVTSGSAPMFDPSRAVPIPAASAPVMTTAQVAQPTAPLSPEDIIRGTMGGGMSMPGMMPGMMPMQPGMMMPGQPMMQPGMHVPSWVAQDQMRTTAGAQPAQPMMQTVMTPNGPMMVQVQPGMTQMVGQPMMQQGMTMAPGMMMAGQPMMMPGMPMQMMPAGGLAVNPHFMGRATAPFN